jgi:hypothetical protein
MSAMGIISTDFEVMCAETFLARTYEMLAGVDFGRGDYLQL